MKKTALGAGSKAMHLTYLGDATIGANVNIGAGTITCNYDGETQAPRRHRGRRVHRQRLTADRAGDDRQGRLCRHRDDGPGGRAAGRAGRQRRQAANIEGWVESGRRSRKQAKVTS